MSKYVFVLSVIKKYQLTYVMTVGMGKELLELNTTKD